MMDELDELRVRIAKELGYIDHGIMRDGAHEFYLPSGENNQYFYLEGRYGCDIDLPDWTRDFDAAMELIKDLHAAGYLIQIAWSFVGSSVLVTDGSRNIICNGAGKEIPEAICRSWLAWKEAG